MPIACGVVMSRTRQNLFGTRVGSKADGERTRVLVREFLGPVHLDQRGLIPMHMLELA